MLLKKKKKKPKKGENIHPPLGHPSETTLKLCNDTFFAITPFHDYSGRIMDPESDVNSIPGLAAGHLEIIPLRTA
jgi:hypothetical protein